MMEYGERRLTESIVLVALQQPIAVDGRGVCPFDPIRARPLTATPWWSLGAHLTDRGSRDSGLTGCCRPLSVVRS